MSAVTHASAELRGLALQLLAMPAGSAVLVTSARADEGKTFVASALAAFAASLGAQDVALVDANFERPALGEHYGWGDAPGLAEALRAGGLARIEARETPLQHLRVVPAGGLRDPGLLFRIAALRAVIAQLAQRHALVVIDGGTAPLAGGLAQAVAGVLLVSDCQRTRREAAAGALARLKLPAERMLGAVLNRKEHHIPAAIYRHL
jgi:Mrp family chromosome partitioning ATPase